MNSRRFIRSLMILSLTGSCARGSVLLGLTRTQSKGATKLAVLLFRTLHNSLGASDQFGSNIVSPLSVGGTGLDAECLDVGRREMGHVHLIDLFEHVDDNRGILQSFPRFFLLHGHH